MNKKTIALLDDNKEYLKGYADYLRSREYVVVAFEDACQLDTYLRDHQVDAFIVDLSFPGRSDAGLNYCHELRRRYPLLPIIIHTGLEETANKISAYRLGADDYVVKASEGGPDYLIVVLQAHLARVEQIKQAMEQEREPTETDRLSVDVEGQRIFWDGQELKFSEQEFAIVHTLVLNRGKTVPYEKMMAIVGKHVTTSTMGVAVGRIRKKFKEIDPGFNAIQNNRTHGYRWYYYE